jgi:hypothetical protein
MSVYVFLYIATSSFVFFWCIMRSRKLIELRIYFFSMVNFMLICILFNSVKVTIVFVFYWS